MMMIKKYKWIMLTMPVLLAAALTLIFAACGGGGSTSGDIAKMLEDGIIEKTDLSFSPLDELSLPQVDISIPLITLPDISMDLDVEFSDMMP
jgi:hypothetical protein